MAGARFGEGGTEGLALVHTLIACIKGNIRGIHHVVSPMHLSRYFGDFCYFFNRSFWELQLDASCLSQLNYH